MKARVFWFISLALVLTALVLTVICWRETSAHSAVVAKMMLLEEADRQELRKEAAQRATKGAAAREGGAIAATLSVGCLIVSSWRKEPIWRSPISGLLGAYIVLQIVMT
jgi:hypothetical protein